MPSGWKYKDVINGDTPLKFSHDKKKLMVKLNRKYSKQDTLKLTINYIAQPNTNADKGGNAITDSKGIYFINPNASAPGKPTQIWDPRRNRFLILLVSYIG